MQPGPAPSSPSPATVPGARPGRVVLAALLTEFVVIAAADNQWVAQRVSDHALDHQGSVGFDLAFSLLTFQWRFAPTSNDVFHSLYGQWALLAVVLLGTALLVLGVSRGPATFSRVFFGTWAGVIAFTGFGTVVRGFVADGRLTGDRNRAQFAVFGALGPQQFAFFGSLVLGLLVGLAAAIAAVTGRTAAVVAGAPPIGAAPDAAPGRAAPAWSAPAAPPAPAAPVDSQATTELPAVGAGPETQVIRPVDGGPDPSATGSADATRELPGPQAPRQY